MESIHDARSTHADLDGSAAALPRPRARSSCDCGDPSWINARNRLRALAGRAASKEPSLPPSALGQAHRFSRQTLEQVLRSAVALHAHGGEATSTSVVWRDAGDELLVTPAKARIATAEGLVFIGLAVFCEESGQAEATVIFACNPAKSPLGIMLVAEGTPRGPRVVVERWAGPLVACAYGALLESLSALVQGAPGEALVLAGFGADPEGVVVVMQRDHDPLAINSASRPE